MAFRKRSLPKKSPPVFPKEKPRTTQKGQPFFQWFSWKPKPEKPCICHLPKKPFSSIKLLPFQHFQRRCARRRFLRSCSSKLPLITLIVTSTSIRFGTLPYKQLVPCSRKRSHKLVTCSKHIQTVSQNH